MSARYTYRPPAPRYRPEILGDYHTVIANRHVRISVHTNEGRRWYDREPRTRRCYLSLSGTFAAEKMYDAAIAAGIREGLRDDDLKQATRAARRAAIAEQRVIAERVAALCGIGRVSFSQKAGCSCGCSPGWTSTEKRPWTIFVKVEEAA